MPAITAKMTSVKHVSGGIDVEVLYTGEGLPDHNKTFHFPASASKADMQSAFDTEAALVLATATTAKELEAAIGTDLLTDTVAKPDKPAEPA